LAQAEVDGRQLTAEEFTSFFLLLINAGGDTTRNLIGAATATLLRQPEKLAWLREDLDGRMSGAVEELLRYQSPVIYMRRTATEDFTLGDADIKAGDKLGLYYGAANRDPNAFDRPDELILDRSPNDHFAFGGGGPHFCLGSHFGRIEVKAMMTQMLTRFPDLELTGDPTWLASNFISGPIDVPVRYTPSKPLGV
jgi:cytochrome P450